MNTKPTKNHMKKSLLSLAILATLISVFGTPAPNYQPVSLAWNPSPSPGITNYVLYYAVGPAAISGWNGTNIVYGNYTNAVDCGNVTSFTVNLPRGSMWYFAVTPQDNTGTEGDYSNEARKTTTGKPAKAQNLTAQ